MKFSLLVLFLSLQYLSIGQVITREYRVFNRHNNTLYAYKTYKNDTLIEFNFEWLVKNNQYFYLLEELKVVSGIPNDILETAEGLIRIIQKYERNTILSYKNSRIKVVGSRKAKWYIDGGYHIFDTIVLNQLKRSLLKWLEKDPDRTFFDNS